MKRIGLLAALGTLALCAQTASQKNTPVRKTTPSVATPSIPAGTMKLNDKDGQQYSWIPAGSFLMGCSPGDECGEDEKPAHRVTLTRGFWLGQTEVTVGAYKRYTAETGEAMPPEPKFNSRALNPGWREDRQPIVSVTWDQARNFCQWEGGRLPSEAEWEYAARAGTQGPRYGETDAVAWHAGNSGDREIDSDVVVKTNGSGYGNAFFRNGNRIHPVAQKEASAWQLFDMLGNVWEWTADRYDRNYYRLGPAVNPQGPTSGNTRVTRGGAWFYPAMIARASTRHASEEQGAGAIVGFRCVWGGRAESAVTPSSAAGAAAKPVPPPTARGRSSGDDTADAIVGAVDRFLRGDGRANRGAGESTSANFFGGLWVTAVQGDHVYFNDLAFDTEVGERFPLQKLVVTLKDASGRPVEWHAVPVGEVTIVEVRGDGTRVGTYTGPRINPASIKGANQTPYSIVFN